MCGSEAEAAERARSAGKVPAGWSPPSDFAAGERRSERFFELARGRAYRQASGLWLVFEGPPPVTPLLARRRPGSTQGRRVAVEVAAGIAIRQWHAQAYRKTQLASSSSRTQPADSRQQQQCRQAGNRGLSVATGITATHTVTHSVTHCVTTTHTDIIWPSECALPPGEQRTLVESI